jgi:hypothetical protein
VTSATGGIVVVGSIQKWRYSSFAANLWKVRSRLCARTDALRSTCGHFDLSCHESRGIRLSVTVNGGMPVTSKDQKCTHKSMYPPGPKRLDSYNDSFYDKSPLHTHGRYFFSHTPAYTSNNQDLFSTNIIDFTGKKARLNRDAMSSQQDQQQPRDQTVDVFSLFGNLSLIGDRGGRSTERLELNEVEFFELLFKVRGACFLTAVGELFKSQDPVDEGGLRIIRQVREKFNGRELTVR